MRNVVFAAIGVAALLVSPAVAQSARTPMPSNSTVPTDARGSVAPYVAHEISSGDQPIVATGTKILAGREARRPASTTEDQ